MTSSPRHQEVEDRLRQLLSSEGLPPPDETAHLTRAVIFIWYATKAFVLVDLDEIPEGEQPLEGLDLAALAEDIDPLTGYAETA